MSALRNPPLRPEYERTPESVTATTLERALPWRARSWSHGWPRKGLILLALALLQEVVRNIPPESLAGHLFARADG